MIHDASVAAPAPAHRAKFSRSFRKSRVICGAEARAGVEGDGAIATKIREKPFGRKEQMSLVKTKNVQFFGRVPSRLYRLQ